jgi:hypothetical protein
MRTDGQRPLLITKGNPTSSQGCYQVVPIEHHLYQVYQLSTHAGEACQQHEVHLSLIQAASQVQDTGGGSYLTRSYAVSQAQEAGPTGLHFVQSVGQRGLSLMSEHHSHTIRIIQPVNNRCWECNTHSSNIIIHRAFQHKMLQVLNVRTRPSPS